MTLTEYSLKIQINLRSNIPPENAVMKNSGYMRSYEVNYRPLIGYFTNPIIALVFSSMGILYMFDNTVCHREIIPGVVISVVSSGTKYQMEH